MSAAAIDWSAVIRRTVARKGVARSPEEIEHEILSIAARHATEHGVEAHVVERLESIELARVRRNIASEAASEPCADRYGMLVSFGAAWCGPCRLISPVLDEIAREGGGRFRVAKVNVDDQPALAQRFNIRGIPALLFFSGGVLRHQITGLTGKKAITDKLAEFAAANAGA